MDDKKVPHPADGRQIDEAIALFEGLLQSAPEDQIALEALSLAYEQKGNLPLARATLLRLAQVIIRKESHDAAPAVIQRLKPHTENDFDALEALRSLESLAAKRRAPADGAGATAAGRAAPPAVPRSGVALRRQVLHREMDLAWKLLEDKELTQEEYASLVEDLSRLIADERQTTISLLHVLTDRAFTGIDRILRRMATASKVPFLALENFETRKVDLGGVPTDYLLRQGALPFETLGEEHLIALLNPLDAELQRELAALLGRRCHFYLVTAEAFDAAVKKLFPAAGSAAASDT
jgi:tetratricopeptide (TPR) repeat protein